MKKPTLLLFISFFAFTCFAQQNKNRIAVKETKRFKDFSHADLPVPSIGPVKHQNDFLPGSKVLNKIPIASSSNLYSVIASNATCLSAIPSQNIVLFISRGGGSFGWTGNDIIATWSDDNFVTVHRFKLLTLTDSSHLSRHPAGTLFMPNTGTTPADGFAVYSGMAMDSSGNWNHDFFGSSKLDSTFKDVNYFPLDSPARQEFPRVQFASCNDGKVHVLADGGQNLNSPFTNLSMWTGTFNALNNNFDWEVHTFPLHVKETAAEGDLVVSWDMAWSTSGDTGYVYSVGIDSITNPNDDVIPLVYRTVDHGNTWTYLPPFDFYSIPKVKAKLDAWWQAATGNTDRPRVFFSSSSGSDAIVDKYGNLHIATLIHCGYTKSQDSLLYTFLYEPRYIWDVRTTATGWAASVVDRILTLPVDSSQGLPPGIGWDHRLQMSKTPSEDGIAFLWTDSDTNYFDQVMAPDLFIRVRAIDYGDAVSYQHSITRGTQYDGWNYFMMVADRSKIDPFSFPYQMMIPITTTSFSITANDICTHSFFDGVGVTLVLEDTIAIPNELIFKSSLYPNPASSAITLSMPPQELDAEITILNSLGQPVLRSVLSKGKTSVQMDVSSLPAGIYFVRINQSVVKFIKS